MAQRSQQNPTHENIRKSREGIRKRIKVFGYERIAEEAGLKAYQTVMRYCDGHPVRPTTEQLIISALERMEGERVRQTRQINESVNEGLTVVPLSKFNELQRQVEVLSGQLGMLMKTQLAAHQWVSSEKAASILNCSLITLHRKKKAGEIEFQMQGSRVTYSIDSLIKSLQDRHLKPEVIQERVMSAILT